MDNKVYLCIDLKSFYASVECVERGLDPLVTNLVVADSSRTEKTICLAVSPSLKSFGLPGRARLFEVVQKVREINNKRRYYAPSKRFKGESYNLNELNNDKSLSLSYIVATPQMAHYIDVSAKIYNIYLKYVAKEDIHVYSIDEVFMDITKYLKVRNMNAHDFARMIIKDVLNNTGITATAGIGTNMYLAKVAMDIVAKHIPADIDGVRIAELDEMSYRYKLWDHRPLTDFWRVGRGISKRLENLGLYTMGDIALCSEGKAMSYYNEDLLYKEFGINAELLIDHAWGYEPTTIEDIKKYKPKANSLSNGQVLSEGYKFDKAKIVVKEMMETLALDLVNKKLVTNHISLAIGYDIDNLKDNKYQGEVDEDYMGRTIPKGSHSSIHLDYFTYSSKDLREQVSILFDRIVNPSLLVRRINIGVSVYSEEVLNMESFGTQLSLFESLEEKNKKEEKRTKNLEKDKKIQKSLLEIKNKYGKNSILKAMDYEEGATQKDRNEQIGGHKA